jgi:hypothetical protein
MGAAGKSGRIKMSLITIFIIFIHLEFKLRRWLIPKEQRLWESGDFLFL